MRTISSRIKTLLMIENDEKTGQLSLRPKKEQILILKEKNKLETALGGIKQMHKAPAALFVVDPKTDEIAVKEARKLKIPVIAIADTNADPDMIDYLIPGNDDLQESINLIVNFVAEVYGDALGIKLAPSVLKTKIVKREYPAGERPRNDRRDRNNDRPYRSRRMETGEFQSNKTRETNSDKNNVTKTEKPLRTKTVKKETTEE
jgi:small subunit ribosomal protein S2